MSQGAGIDGLVDRGGAFVGDGLPGDLLELRCDGGGDAERGCGGLAGAEGAGVFAGDLLEEDEGTRVGAVDAGVEIVGCGDGGVVGGVEAVPEAGQG